MGHSTHKFVLVKPPSFLTTPKDSKELYTEFINPHIITKLIHDR